MEHFHHFGLAEDPFRNEPILRFLYESQQQREALRRMDRAARQAKGLCVLIGEVGSGKTMAVRQLLEDLEEEVFEASMLVVLNGSPDAAWVLTRFARQLGIEEPPVERDALMAAVYERLAIIREDGRHAVLIIDDAQALAAPQTLADVCALVKLEYEDRRLLTMVLAGTPRLAEALAADPALAQRVDVKVSLEPLAAASAAAYLAHRVQVAQGAAEILEPAAVAALHNLGRGIPGLMNTLADNALFEAFLCGRSTVSDVDVERAHSDLGWVGDAAPAAAATAPETASPTVQPSPAETVSVVSPVANKALDELPSSSTEAAAALQSSSIEAHSELPTSSSGAPSELPPSESEAPSEREAPAVAASDAVEATVAASSSPDEPLLDLGDPLPASNEPLEGSLDDLDSDLEAIFEMAEHGGGFEAELDSTATAVTLAEEGFGSALVDPREGPPKDESEEFEDLLVELVDD